MCGIDVVISLQTEGSFSLPSPCVDSRGSQRNPSPASARRDDVRRRGTDFADGILVITPNFQMDMFSSVLHIQGEIMCSQPLTSSITGSMLLWNGEYLNHVDSHEPDTKLVLDLLESGCSVVEALDSIQGPFAFVYYDKPTSRVWFGKDKQGRRSLLYRVSADSRELVISSTCLMGGVEIPAGTGLCSVSLETFVISHHDWLTPIAFSSPDFLYLSNSTPVDIQSLHSTLKSTIKRHMTSVSVPSRLGILFSGGVDSAIMAAIAAELFTTHNHHLTGIDLINIASATTASPDRATSLVSYDDLITLFPSVPFRMICVDIQSTDLAQHESRIMRLASPNNSHMDFNISSALWFGGRGDGRILSPSFRHAPEWQVMRAQIIQSESVDSAVENRRPKKGQNSSSPPSVCPVCLKRKSKPGCAYSACKICCIPHTANGSHCPAHSPYSNHPIIPLLSVSDFVEGHLEKSHVTSDCRVLLVGHGADELFGGYGRHETKGKTAGLDGLRDEMLLDLGRLWTRNLGRDDRIIGDHARDTRHPFLDESVVAWVGALSVASMQSGEPGENKPILRRLAREQLGMTAASMFRKRAIQFGTRLAQQTNISVHGSHSKGSGRDAYIASNS